MRSLRRKSRWRLGLGRGSLSRRTSATYRDCAVCVRLQGPPAVQPPAHRHSPGHRVKSKSSKGRSKSCPRVICYCDTNADTLPPLAGNCYRSFCTAGVVSTRREDRSAPTFRCLNVARDHNLRSNHPCPCDAAPSSNGDHNFFFGLSDLNNNSDEKSGGSKGQHVMLDDTCLRCCVLATQAPPRLYCFKGVSVLPPDDESCCGCGSACGGSVKGSDSAVGGGTPKRGRRRSRLSLPLPNPFRKPSHRRCSAPPPLPPLLPVPVARSTAPPSTIVSNPLYQDAARADSGDLSDDNNVNVPSPPPLLPLPPEEPPPDFDDPERNTEEGLEDEPPQDRPDSATSLSIGPSDRLSPGYFLDTDCTFKVAEPRRGQCFSPHWSVL